jgi:hypothetical protein
MTCERCGARMRARRSTAKEPDRYLIGGLPTVGLVGVTVHTCPTCGRVGVTIPKVGLLHQAIAEALLAKAGPLEGDELRFLRKHAGIAARASRSSSASTPRTCRASSMASASLARPRSGWPVRSWPRPCSWENIREILLGARSEKAPRKPPVFVMRGERWRQTA